MDVDTAKIRRLRLARAWTQATLATKVGCAVKTLQRIEMGKNQPQPGTLQALAVALGVAASELLVAEGRPAHPPSTRQVAAPPLNFVGRQEELHALETTISAGVLGGMVITGMPGIGKTALARASATRAQAEFPDGHLFLDLLGSTSPVSPQHIMRHLLWSLHPDVPNIEDDHRLEATYRSAIHGKRLFLLLDDASGAEQIAPLMPFERGFILVTSRRRLTMPGMGSLPIAPLERASSCRLIDSLAGVREYADTLAELCGDLPLALTIAASTVSQPDIDVREYIARLGPEPQRLRELDGISGASRVERALTRSIAFLGPTLRTRFSLLAIFQQDFDRRAAAAVWRIPTAEAATDLTKLCSLHLLEHDGQRGAKARYRLHTLVKALLSAELGDAMRLEAELRSAQHFWEMIRRVAIPSQENGEPGSTPEAVTRDIANIEHAFEWCARNAERSPQAKQLLLRLPTARALASLQLPSVRLDWCSRAIQAAVNIKDSTLLAKLHERAGSALTDKGELRAAIDHLDKALEQAASASDPLFEATILLTIGSNRTFLGAIDLALPFLEKALAAAVDLGNAQLEIEARRGLGIACGYAGELLRSLVHLEEGIECARRIEEEPLLSAALNAKAIVSYVMGAYQEASLVAEESLEITRAGSATNIVAGMVHAWAIAKRGRVDAACEEVEQQLACVQMASEPRLEAYGLLAGADVAWASRNTDLALERIARCAELARAMEFPWLESFAVVTQGEFAMSDGATERAAELLEQGLRIASAIGDRRGQARARWSLAELDAANGHWPAALASMQSTLAYEEEMKLSISLEHKRRLQELRQEFEGLA